jgi:sulfate transport system ATP-binding protein
MSIEIRDLSKAFGSTVVCDRLDLTIDSGELVALLGPSGSGKTTLLRILAGLEIPDAGSVRFDGKDTTTADVRDRGVGFVFQHYALFNHLTVFENVAFGLRVKPKAQRPTQTQIGAQVARLLELVQLGGLADRYPHQLSGGQRQRVALARALAVDPKVLLLDEPFGALDASVRKELRRWLRRLHDEVRVTSVFVTHDQEEAMEVADRIVVMNRGRIEQVGTPEEIYDRPATPFVLGFLGGASPLPAPTGTARHDEHATAYARAHDIEILPGDTHGAHAATLGAAVTVGPVTRIECQREIDGLRVEVELPRSEFRELRDRHAMAAGSRVFLRPRRLLRFPQALSRT